MVKNRDKLHTETPFEEYIVSKIAENKGWVVSDNDDGFDPDTALVPSDFIEYLNRTSPEKVVSLRLTME